MIPLTQAEQGQAIVLLGFSAYFVLLLLQGRLRKHERVWTFLSNLTTFSVLLVLLLLLWQVRNDLTMTRVSQCGVHTINVILFGLGYFVFALSPDYDFVRGLVLVMHLLGLHEICWNILYYGFVHPELAYHFLYWSYPSTVLLLASIFFGFSYYRETLQYPSIAAITTAFFYGMMWLTIGFPVTISTYSNPQVTQFFYEPFVNMIENGYVIAVLFTFYFTYLGREIWIKHLQQF